MNFELRQGDQGDRPMSVDKLRDSASTRRQRRRNLKGEGYTQRLLRSAGLRLHTTRYDFARSLFLGILYL
ncbi:NADH:ubiquinone oxidoreductase membrane subunit A [Candidatus Regiella insecticola]|uniref:NADH:ubiquinone oxidoreductase membrane subunit A n=2 Tax=Candidatus Regiella insecticola TaxID=138073 RepID=A0A6L2ZNR0_9ENTR|nr:NADH:ubiquinone oxidoreductase membrane subunit A [Candidatus Regiella insecticola]